MNDEALERARARARDERRKAESPRGTGTDPTTAVGMALVRAALEKARKS